MKNGTRRLFGDRTRFGTIAFFVLIASFVVACSSPSPSSSVPGSSSTGPITLTVSVVRDANNGSVIEGTTNLPSGTKIGVELRGDGGYFAQDFAIYVIAGQFKSSSFRNRAVPLAAGQHQVHVLSYFNAVWQTNAVLKVVGQDGRNLATSSVIHLEDAQLIDSPRVLDYVADIPIPALQALIPEALAIATVRNATLVVDGRRSSETVEAGVTFFLTLPGQNQATFGNGWSAILNSDGSYSVALDFINVVNGTKQHEQAIWQVKLDTREVLYRNQNAKMFSYVPSK